MKTSSKRVNGIYCFQLLIHVSLEPELIKIFYLETDRLHCINHCFQIDRRLCTCPFSKNSDYNVVTILVEGAFSFYLIAYILFELIHSQSIEKHFVFLVSVQNHCTVYTCTIITAFTIFRRMGCNSRKFE